MRPPCDGLCATSNVAHTDYRTLAQKLISPLAANFRCESSSVISPRQHCLPRLITLRSKDAIHQILPCMVGGDTQLSCVRCCHDLHFTYCRLKSYLQIPDSTKPFERTHSREARQESHLISTVRLPEENIGSQIRYVRPCMMDSGCRKRHTYPFI